MRKFSLSPFTLSLHAITVFCLTPSDTENPLDIKIFTFNQTYFK